MKKKSIALVLALLLCAVSIPFSTAAAVTSEQASAMSEEALIDTSVGIAYYGSGLLIAGGYVYGANPDPTYYTVALQQYNNGTWSNWTSYSGFYSDYHMYIEQPVQPPKGYWYRTKFNLSSFTFPNVEVYSRELYY